MNWKTTLEVNTPSHEQCVVAHLERNTSRSLLLDIRRYGTFLPGHEIKEITYLDPFDVRQEVWCVIRILLWSMLSSGKLLYE